MVLTNEIDGINVKKQNYHRVLQWTNVINIFIELTLINGNLSLPTAYH